MSEFGIPRGARMARCSATMLGMTDVATRTPTSEQLDQMRRLCELTGTTVAPGKTFTAWELSQFVTALRKKMARW